MTALLTSSYRPFYQPLAAYELFTRVLAGTDMATGTIPVTMGGGYSTNGTATSTYREGISTVQFQVINVTDTYNTTTNEPNPFPPSRRSVVGRSTKLW